MRLGVFLTRFEDFSAAGLSGGVAVVLHGGTDRWLWVVEKVAESEKEEKGERKWGERRERKMMKNEFGFGNPKFIAF